MKVLLLEDDKVLNETIKEVLEDNDFKVTSVFNSNDAISITYDEKFDVYIFDINLPDISGIELLKSLKDANDTTPTIFISANIDINTITKGFEAGAYDYIKKPFSPEELLVRLNSRFKNTGIISYNNIKYNKLSQEIFINDKQIHLSYTQFAIFELLFLNISRVISKNDLLDCLDNGSDSALRFAINKLKNTLNIDIKNIRGVGYSIQ